MHTTTLRGTTARLQRTALVHALARSSRAARSAHKATGGIFDSHAAANSAVSIENTETGLKRAISADANGRFAFNQLPTGKYKVTTGSDTREVTVRIGTGSEVTFSPASQSLETIEVTGNAINPIDVSSVESATVFYGRTDYRFAGRARRIESSRCWRPAPSRAMAASAAPAARWHRSAVRR